MTLLLIAQRGDTLAKIFDAKVGDLSLDLSNPRIESATSQPDALRQLIQLNENHFRHLIRSVMQNGLDPGDAFYVTNENGEYVVLDGNRRLAALKVLRNPILLKGAGIDEASEKRILKDIGDFRLDPNYEVRAFPFLSRPEAEGWIERRHGNNLDGEGRINWDPKQIQRFRRDRSVLDLIDFVDSHMKSSPDWPSIKASVEANTSTLKRFLDSKSGRQFLGYRPSDANQQPTTTKEKSYLAEVLLRIFSDIKKGNISSRTHNKASEIRAYFDGLPATLRKKGEVEQPARTFESMTSVTIASAKGVAAKPSKIVTSGSKVSRIRDTLAPTKFHFNEPTIEKGKQLFREASKIKTGSFPLSCAFLFRSILEFTLETYMRAHRIRKGELKPNFEAVFQHLTNADPGLKNDLKAVRQTLTNGPMSIEALNGYVHNRIQLPNESDLRTAWDHADALFLAVFGERK